MNTFFVIIAILGIVVNAFIALMLFAIWRSIIGKSSVDLKLGTIITLMTKKLETLSGSMDNNTTQNSDIGKQLKEVARNIEKAFEEKKD